MSHITLQCHGLPCPQPVVQCREAIEREAPDQLTILVDNEAAEINITRFLSTIGYSASSTASEGGFTITAIKNPEQSDSSAAECEPMENPTAPSSEGKTVVFIASDVIGSGDDQLGAKLMYNFLLTLKEMGPQLWRIVMVNGGVKLATQGSPCVEVLQQLEETGVSVLVCGACLEHFGLTKDKQVGEVTNMLDIVTSFQLAAKTIRA